MPKVDFGSVMIHLCFVVLLIIAIWLFISKFSVTMQERVDVSMYERPTWSEETQEGT